MSRFERWSRRKRGLDTAEEEMAQPGDAQEASEPKASEREEKLSAESKDASPGEPAIEAGSLDAELPDPETLEPGSGLNAYLQAGVSPELKRRALRRMFTAPSYNVRDGLDDYDQDFTQMRKLGSETTAQLRRWIHKLAEDDVEVREAASSETDQSRSIASSSDRAETQEAGNGDPAEAPTDPERPTDGSV